MANPPAENAVIPFSNKENALPLLLTLVPASTCSAWYPGSVRGPLNEI